VNTGLYTEERSFRAPPMLLRSPRARGAFGLWARKLLDPAGCIPRSDEGINGFQARAKGWYARSVWASVVHGCRAARYCASFCSGASFPITLTRADTRACFAVGCDADIGDLVKQGLQWAGSFNSHGKP